jgi:hypothetical protein
MESNALALVASNDEVKISFNDNKMLYFSSNRKTIDRKTIQNLGDGFRFYGFKNIHEEIVSDVIKIHRISTFEQPIKTQSATQKHLEKIKTDLYI